MKKEQLRDLENACIKFSEKQREEKKQWYNESKTDERMNVIGQNGNDGEHYESENTAVDWLTEKLKFDFGFVFSNNIFEKAKEIEKQQIKDAYDVKWVEFIVNGEDYYNQKFKKK